MPSYNMLPNVCLCCGGVRAVGTRVGLCQLSMGVHMIIQMAPEEERKKFFLIALEIAH